MEDFGGARNAPIDNNNNIGWIEQLEGAGSTPTDYNDNIKDNDDDTIENNDNDIVYKCKYNSVFV